MGSTQNSVWSSHWKDRPYDPVSGKTVSWNDDVIGAGVDVTTNNYHDVLDIDKKEAEILQDNHIMITEYINVGAGIRGGSHEVP